MGSEQLPHLNIEDNPNKRSKKKMFLIAVFSFLLLSLPVSVYLVGQQQQLSSQASNETPVNLEKSITLSTPDQAVGVGQNIPVDILIRSDNQNINLASVKLQFNPSLVKVTELLTNTSQSQNNVFFGKYWLSKGYDNDKGEIHLTAGGPRPGVQTTPGGQTYLLAQIRFVTLAEGQTEISLDPGAILMANSDNQKIEFIKNNLSLNIARDASLISADSAETFSGRILPRWAEMQPSSEIKEQLTLTSPKSGEVFFYFRPIELTWSGTAEKIKSLILYLNGEPYGVVAENLPNNGSYAWTPSISVPLTMIVPENTYSFQLVSQTRDGKENRSDASIPFGIISDPNGKITTTPNTQTGSSDSLTTEDSSKMLSRWGENLNQESPLDLNGDMVINFLDWYLLRKSLFVKDLVY